MTIPPPDSAGTKPDSFAARQLLGVVALIAALTAMRVIYAGVIDLRTDEAYYWTWSKESVLSFLDHPPMIAWFIRFGTAIFGDTNLGVRFAGIVAMLVTQLLLADIVRRVTHDVARGRDRGADAGGRALLRAADVQGLARRRDDPVCGRDAVGAGAASREQ